jgi:hypothetical protein
MSRSLMTLVHRLVTQLWKSDQALCGLKNFKALYWAHFIGVD